MCLNFYNVECFRCAFSERHNIDGGMVVIIKIISVLGSGIKGRVAYCILNNFSSDPCSCKC